jgi:hypothetical protein
MSVAHETTRLYCPLASPLCVNDGKRLPHFFVKKIDPGLLRCSSVVVPNRVRGLGDDQLRLAERREVGEGQ